MAFRRATASLIPQVVAGVRAASGGSVPCVGSKIASSVAPARSAVSGARLFHATPSVGSRLAEVLQREAKYENDNYEQPEEVAAGPPGGFTLTETKGDCLLKLTKTFGAESVVVEVLANEPTEEVELVDESGEEIVTSSIGFSVVVTKGDKSLVFTCTAGPDDGSDGSVTIESATLEPAEGEPEESAYSGPIYDELDPELTAEFDHYLRERGVDEALVRYVSALAADKEAREYADWLGNVKAFVQ